MRHNLLVISSKISGKSGDDALQTITDFLDAKKVTYQLRQISKPPDAAKHLRPELLKDVTVVVVFGGDGTATGAVKAMQGSKTPLLIIPGGTANILASELGVSGGATDCLSALLDGQYQLRKIDVATVNGEPLVLDMHTGFWSEAILSTSRQLKSRIGAAAYAWSALRRIGTAEKATYEISTDGSAFRTIKGYTLLIANRGDSSVLGQPLFSAPHIDGVVQYAVVKSLDKFDLSRWFFTRFLFGRSLRSVIETHRAHTLRVRSLQTDWLMDDFNKKLPEEIIVEGTYVGAYAYGLPANHGIARRNRWYVRARLFLHRRLTRMDTVLRGIPPHELTRLSPHLYLGGQYKARAHRSFEEWGITGVVNMRNNASFPVPPAQVQVLQLPTRDRHAPTLDSLAVGVEFIRTQIAAGGSVYIHCRLGEGRGPTMAAAYLIANGLSVEESIEHMRKYRPVANPNARQRQQLEEWLERCRKLDPNPVTLL